MDGWKSELSHLSEIVKHFKIEGEIQQITPYGSGHINQTFKILTRDAQSPNYLLQKINTHVFKDPISLQNNITHITAHLQKKTSNLREIYNSFASPTLIFCKNGKSYHKKNHSDPLRQDYWRLYEFIDGSYYYDIPQNLTQVFEAGKLFGTFELHLSDLSPQNISVTIPNFHNLAYRIKNLKIILRDDPFNRKKNVLEEISFIRSNYTKLNKIHQAIADGNIPLRITHNDTKFNNVLFNNKDEAISIVDLDTVMPGRTLFDYGDAIRSLVNTIPEDFADPSQLEVDLESLEAFSRGFLPEINKLLNSEEKSLFHLSPLVMGFMLGIRFLTDYLDGDRYFSTTYPLQNYDRARVQFKLVEKMQNNIKTIQEICKKYVASDK